MTSNVAVTADDLAAAIRDAITSGKLAGGAPITEKWASETYGVSRLTVREVLQSLIAEGYLVRERHHSAQVREFTEDEVREIFEARELLDSHAAIKAVNASEHARARLKRSFESYREAMLSGDRTEVSRRHNELHVALVGMADNRRLMKQAEQLMTDSSMIVAVIDTRRDDVDKMIRVHAQLVDAFLDGDQVLARLLVREHLQMVGRAAHEEIAVPNPKGSDENES